MFFIHEENNLPINSHDHAENYKSHVQFLCEKYKMLKMEHRLG